MILINTASGTSLHERASPQPNPPPYEREEYDHNDGLLKRFSLSGLQSPFKPTATIIHRKPSKPRRSIRSLERPHEQETPP